MNFYPNLWLKHKQWTIEPVHHLLNQWARTSAPPAQPKNRGLSHVLLRTSVDERPSTSNQMQFKLFSWSTWKNFQQMLTVKGREGGCPKDELICSLFARMFCHKREAIAYWGCPHATTAIISATIGRTLIVFPFITARKRSLGQGNIFSSVCHGFCTQGGLPQCMLRYHPAPPPTRQAPPWTRQVPPQDQVPPGPGTLQTRQAPLPPKQSMLGDTVNERTVCILLECNLVFNELQVGNG